MQLVKEMLDPTIAQDSTPVPQFKFNYYYDTESSIDDLGEPTEENTHLFFVRSEQYFRIKYKASARDNIENINDLAIEIIAPHDTSEDEHESETSELGNCYDTKTSHFDQTASDRYTTTAFAFRIQANNNQFSISKHSRIVTDHVKIYRQKSDALVQLDQKILSAMLIAIGATCVPFIPFMGLVSIAGWIATFYLLNQRADRYTAYRDALSLLVGTCNWALGAPSHQRVDNPTDLAKAPAIKSMMECLYPVLSKTQIEHLIADDIQETYSDSLKNYDQRFKFPLAGRLFTPQNENRTHQIIHNELESTALKQRGAEFVRCVYGLNRGTAKDFFLVALNALPDIWNAFSNITRALCTTTPAPTSELRI